MKKNPYEKALGYAYRLLNIRMRSTKEVYTRLRGKGYSRKTIKGVISNLEKTGYLDDLKFAKTWIENRLAFKPKGILALQYELKGKGIPSSAVDTAIKAIDDKENGFDEYRVAKELTEERKSHLTNLPEIKQKKKLHDLLRRRGFKFEVIERILTETFNSTI